MHLALESLQLLFLGLHPLHTGGVQRFHHKAVQLLLKVDSLLLIDLQIVLHSYLSYKINTRYIWLSIWISYNDYYYYSRIYKSSTWSAKPIGSVTDGKCFTDINFSIIITNTMRKLHITHSSAWSKFTYYLLKAFAYSSFLTFSSLLLFEVPLFRPRSIWFCSFIGQCMKGLRKKWNVFFCELGIWSY